MEQNDFRLHLNHAVTLLDATGKTLWVGAIGDFFDANEMSEDERDEIHFELSGNGWFSGGGGASPAWKLFDRVFGPSAPRVR